MAESGNKTAIGAIAIKMMDLFGRLEMSRTVWIVAAVGIRNKTGVTAMRMMARLGRHGL